MEDMLSAVDQSSVAVIMDRLFGKTSGLMKELGTTVVMATNSSTLIRSQFRKAKLLTDLFRRPSEQSGCYPHH